VREQVTDGDVVDGAVGVMDLAEFGDVADGGVIEGEQATVAQLEDGDGGEGLGNGGPVVGRGGVDGLMGVLAGFAVKELQGFVVGVDECECAAYDAVTIEGGVEAGVECVDLRERRSGDGKSQQEDREGARRVHVAHHTFRERLRRQSDWVWKRGLCGP
jgi:hypothetical protein